MAQAWDYDGDGHGQQDYLDGGASQDAQAYQMHYYEGQQDPGHVLNAEDDKYKLDPNDQVVLMLQLMHNESPHVECLDLSNKNITKLDKIFVEIAKFEEVTDLHLANNSFRALP